MLSFLCLGCCFLVEGNVIAKNYTGRKGNAAELLLCSKQSRVKLSRGKTTRRILVSADDTVHGDTGSDRFDSRI